MKDYREQENPKLCRFSLRHKKKRLVAFFVLVIILCVGLFNLFKPMPEGTDFASKTHIAKSEDIRFLGDLSFMRDGKKIKEQFVFDQILERINKAEHYILLDMFLFNDLGADPEHRKLASEIADALVARKQTLPDIKIDFLSDPINTAYGGASSPEFDKLRAADINVIITDLDPLRDSNPIYSSLWRPFLYWLGVIPTPAFLPHPFGRDGAEVNIGSYLALPNFKANHRKIFISDDAGKMHSIISSGNPHAGSAAHSNAAIEISGDFWQSLWFSESAVAKLSGVSLQSPPVFAEELHAPGGDHQVALELLTEKAIKRALLEATDACKKDDEIIIAAFYLADRDLVDALLAASQRDVRIRLILDPNRDAFGYEKIGIPNRPVAAELLEDSQGRIAIRWYDTHGEQFHTKLAYFAHKDGPSRVIMGSANFTRRNLENYNLESSVSVVAQSSSIFIQDTKKYLERIWQNEDGSYSTDYENYADDALWKYVLYRIQEGFGLGSF